MAQHYDVTLKMLLQDSVGRAIQVATGLIVNPRVDLLGQTDDGSLLHLELQVGNDVEMPQRMAEYALAIYRKFGKFARQIVLYAGEPELRMKRIFKARVFPSGMRSWQRPGPSSPVLTSPTNPLRTAQRCGRRTSSC